MLVGYGRPGVARKGNGAAGQEEQEPDQDVAHGLRLPHLTPRRESFEDSKDSKDIQISLQDNLLTIKGEKRHEKEEKDEHYHRVERAYGSFTRSVRLPVAVDGGKVTATFKNGLLTVTLPKTPSARGTMIPAKAE